jgi:glucose/arabinose dehydrogenase
MGRLVTILAVASIVGAAGCGGDSNSPQSPPGSGGGQTITGRERFGWTQSADNPGDLGQYDYALYVDGSRRVIENETCTATSATTLECSAQLPTLTPGNHTLELAAFIIFEGTVIEGPRTAAMSVTVAGLTGGTGDGSVSGGTFTSSDGLPFHADVLASDLDRPVDLAVAADGRVLVAEKSGRVRVIGSETTSTDVLRDLLRVPGAELTSIALEADAARTGGVLIAYIDRADRGRVLRLARVRESGGTFSQAAVISSQAIDGAASAVVRIGPDGLVYVGVGSGSESDAAQSVANPEGKILRLRADGTTPDDNPWSTPAFSIGHRDPRGLAWHPQTGAMLEVEGGDVSEEMNAIRPGANYGWPPTGRAVARESAPSLRFPNGTLASGIAVMGAAAGALAGDVIVSSLGAEDLLRVRIDANGRARITARLLQQRFGRIAQVASRDDALYVITDNRDRLGEAADALVRITPR